MRPIYSTDSVYILTVTRKDTEDAANTELLQTSNTNPWKEIERTVRRVDEEKVKDCTEDIDALLVFVRPIYVHWDFS